MPCDATDDCPYPGKPGYDGALEPENIEMAEAFKRYRSLGAWTLERVIRRMTDAQAEEFTYLIYELDIENRRLKQAYPDVRLLWDADAG